MPENKNNFRSHFHSPKIPAPPLLSGEEHQSKFDEKPKSDKTPKKESPSLNKWFKRQPKKKKIIIIISAVTAILLVAFLSWFFIFRSTEPEPVAVIEEPEPVATTEPSRLTGLEVGFEVNQRPVTAVMVENSPEARPQSGLNEAGVIYEAIAEGGITRFVALYQDTLPKVVGPVRSVRPYYLDYIVPYDAAIAHVGGSAVALQQIKAENLKDLDQFSNPGPYWRDSNRYAPHNMYTDINKLLELQKEKGWGANDYPGLIRGAEAKQADAITAKNISINISRSLYKVDYAYDASSNSYLRTLGGKPHIDATSGKQLSPNIVVIPIVPRSQNGIYSVYGVDGTGQVLVFQNGQVLEGSWKKSNRSNQLSFLDSEGKPLQLAAGQTWITLTASQDSVSYSP